jgi:aspartate dehydrogenase
MKGKIKIAILGCGAIGSELARTVDRRLRADCRLVCVSDIERGKAEALARSLRSKPMVVSRDAMIRRADLIIEAASTQAAGPLARDALLRHKFVLVMSVGGLLGEPGIFRVLKKTRGRLFLPSGAIAGIDALLAGRMGKIKSVELVTRKPPSAFQDVPSLRSRRRWLRSLKRETLLFAGPAGRAVKAFPQNINVAALLSLAGIGPRRTRVKIYASPGLKKNVHQVEIVGNFGRILTVTENVPSPKNPKTSYLAALSPAALLEKIVGAMKVGT